MLHANVFILTADLFYFFLVCSSCVFQITYRRWTFPYYSKQRLEEESCAKVDGSGSWDPEFCLSNLPFLCEKPPRKQIIFFSSIKDGQILRFFTKTVKNTHG